MDAPEILAIPGVVASGMGKGAHFIALEWVRTQLVALIGAPPYPGTLNLRVPVDMRDRLFAQRQRFAAITPPGEGDCPGYLVAVRLRRESRREVHAWAVLPELSVHPDTIEVVSSHFLREFLGLQDGDLVELHVEIS